MLFLLICAKAILAHNIIAGEERSRAQAKATKIWWRDAFRANDQTAIWAENRYTTVDVVFVEVGAFRIPYSGSAIFKVEAAKDSEDEGEFRPPAPLNAIVGVGWSAEHNGLSGGIGVAGQGSPVGGLGVRSRGLGGAGVHARSEVDRGDVFEADHEAQVRLVPRRVRTCLPETTAVTPAGIAPSALASGVVSLPKSGEAGDLMTLIDDAGHCTLWFCVQDASGAGPARWAQVLLGPAFNGQS